MTERKDFILTYMKGDTFFFVSLEYTFILINYTINLIDNLKFNIKSNLLFLEKKEKNNGKKRKIQKMLHT